MSFFAPPKSLNLDTESSTNAYLRRKYVDASMMIILYDALGKGES